MKQKHPINTFFILLGVLAIAHIVIYAFTGLTFITDLSGQPAREILVFVIHVMVIFIAFQCWIDSGNDRL